MPRDKDLPKKYDIPRERYRELKYFCLQYPRKKERAKDTYALSAAAPSGMPSASGCSDPTAKRAESREREKKDVALRSYSPDNPPIAPKGYRLVECIQNRFGYMCFKYIKEENEPPNRPRKRKNC